MFRRFLAWIVPAGQVGGPHPEHPIVLPPEGGQPPEPGYPAYPAHPIVLPPEEPGYPAHPIVLPPGTPIYPAHPIVLPPYPDNTLPTPPPVVWPPLPTPPPGGDTGSPSNPINLPPSGPGGVEPGFWVMVYMANLNGWVWAWIPVGGTKASTGKK
jgi:hypothetical protein